MKILCDSREKKGKNEHVLNYFRENGIEYVEGVTFNVGDYRLEDNPNVIIDRKQGLQEVYSNVIHSHERFKRECLRAIEQNVTLFILVEEHGIKNLDEVPKWQNKRLKWWHMVTAAQRKGKMLGIKLPKKPPISSATLAKTLKTFEEKYKVKFVFCSPNESGKRMIEILTGRYTGDSSDD